MMLSLYLIDFHYCVQKPIMIILFKFRVNNCVPAVIIYFFKSEMTESLLFANGALEESIYTLLNQNLVRKRSLRAHR